MREKKVTILNNMDKHTDVKHLLRVKLMELVGDDVGLGLILMVLPFLYF